MRKKLTFLVLFIFIMGALAFGIEFSRKEREETYKELEIFGDALHLVQTQYVESESAKDLIYGALKGLLSALDPYSQFLKPEDYKELLVDTKGEFGGLGIEISIKDGLLTVISPLEDTPAWREGIKAGDRIVEIEGELTRGITLMDAVKKLRGKPGTDVNITILREKTGEILEIIITREIIQIQDIRKSAVLRGNVGYIRINEFREDTADELDDVLKKLKKEGAKGYILDLRNNPGGLLISAVDVASRFLKPDKLVVYTLDRQDTKNEYYSETVDANYTEEPLVVLVNTGSASGSEIVAGCFKDQGRGIVLGEKTFGKASVQTVLPLADGSALRLTTAKYYTPEGILIEKEGIHPDIAVEQREVGEIEKTKEDEIFEELKKDENGESEKEVDEKVEEEKVDESKEDKEFYEKDYQLIRALDLMKGLMILSESKEVKNSKQ